MSYVIPLCDAVRDVRAEHHDLIEEFVAWSTAAGRAADPDTAALLCGSATGWDGTESLTAWHRRRTYRMLRIETFNWCSTRRCLVPDDLPEALWDWFGFLAATGRLDEDSDPVWELRKPLICYGGLDVDGRRQPAGDLRMLVPCECFLPYRETVEAVQGLLDGSRSIEEVLDAIDPYGERDDIRYARPPDLDSDEFGPGASWWDVGATAADTTDTRAVSLRIEDRRTSRKRGVTARPSRPRRRRS